MVILVMSLNIGTDMRQGIVGQNNNIHAILIIFNNFQGVNFTMSKDVQAPEKEPKDRLSSHPSCFWYPNLLKILLNFCSFRLFLKKVKDVVQLISVFGCCNMVRIITNFYEVKILYQKLLRFQSRKLGIEQNDVQDLDKIL